MPYKTLVDHRGVQHQYRAKDVVGTCLCGNPPVGVKGTDPPPNLDPTAPYTEICKVCWQVALETVLSTSASRTDAEKIKAVWDPSLVGGDVSVTGRRAGKNDPGKKRGWFRSDDGIAPVPLEPPDPLTAPWADLVEEA